MDGIPFSSLLQSETKRRWWPGVPRGLPHGILRQRETIVAGLFPGLFRGAVGQTVAGVHGELVEINVGQEFGFVDWR